MKKLTVKMLFPQKKSLMVSIPLANINKAPPSQAKTLAMLKANLGQQKMERARKGPIVASRTSDTVLPSFSTTFSPLVSSSSVFNGIMPFTPLNASTP